MAMQTDSIIDLSRVVAGRDAIQLVSPQLARRLGILPIAVADNHLYIVMADSEDFFAVSQLENMLGISVSVLRAKEPERVSFFLRKYYPEHGNELDGTPLGMFEDIVLRAVLSRSSDIHFNAESESGIIRLRIDGLMQTERTLPLEALNELISAVKVSAGLNIAERRIPQDGQLSLLAGGEVISLRVATIPTLYGEKMTLRIIATENTMSELAELNRLGMSEIHLQLLFTSLATSHGVILLSGPTGSGKTTTLYAALRYLKQSGTLHILSIEDPVEIPLDGINQVRIDSERVDFHRALRSTLRHDPDVMMIGEIRDAETADIAVKSSLTGHLVLSTLHANDSVGVVTRLLNLGIAPELVNSALRLVIAQRLVRCPCPHCVRMESAEVIDREFFHWSDDEEILVPKSVGCPLCNKSGYTGRIGLYEMIPLDRKIREMIRNKADSDTIAGYIFGERSMPTLRSDGADKVRKGLTTPEEVRRVTFLNET